MIKLLGMFLIPMEWGKIFNRKSWFLYTVPLSWMCTQVFAFYHLRVTVDYINLTVNA